MDNKNIQAVADEELNGVAGGYLYVSEWRQKLNGEVLPNLASLRNRAFGTDSAMISEAYNILFATMVPNAEIKSAVYALWDRYNREYAPRMMDMQIKAEFGNILSAAKRYIDQNS